MSSAALTIYQAHADRLAQQYEQVAPDLLFRPVADLLPPACRMADIGAGSGRDAAGFAGRGYQVTAIEPVAPLRDAGRNCHPDADFDWLDDHLPDLPHARGLAPFDLVTMAAVWHHVAPQDRDAALSSLGAILAPSGRMVMSLRHGPVDPARGLFDADARETVALARQHGFSRIEQRKAGSQQPANQQAGISWTWLVMWRD